MDKTTNKQSRRQFLDRSLAAGAGLAAIGLTSMHITKDDDKEMVKMITLDGKLVEVDVKRINKMCAGKVSNKSLKKWIEEEKKQNS